MMPLLLDMNRTSNRKGNMCCNLRYLFYRYRSHKLLFLLLLVISLRLLRYGHSYCWLGYMGYDNIVDWAVVYFGWLLSWLLLLLLLLLFLLDWLVDFDMGYWLGLLDLGYYCWLLRNCYWYLHWLFLVVLCYSLMINNKLSTNQICMIISIMNLNSRRNHRQILYWNRRWNLRQWQFSRQQFYCLSWNMPFQFLSIVL